MTTESSENHAITLSRMNLAGKQDMSPYLAECSLPHAVQQQGWGQIQRMVGQWLCTRICTIFRYNRHSPKANQHCIHRYKHSVEFPASGLPARAGGVAETVLASSSHFCSSGFSLHMFLKLRFNASNREMVVCEKSLPYSFPIARPTSPCVNPDSTTNAQNKPAEPVST